MKVIDLHTACIEVVSTILFLARLRHSYHVTNASPSGAPRGTRKLASSGPAQRTDSKVYVTGRKSGSSKTRDAVQRRARGLLILATFSHYLVIYPQYLLRGD
jgi:hypothetical protein